MVPTRDRRATERAESMPGGPTGGGTGACRHRFACESRANKTIAAASTRSPIKRCGGERRPASPLRARRTRRHHGKAEAWRECSTRPTTVASAVSGTGIPHERCIVTVGSTPRARRQRKRVGNGRGREVRHRGLADPRPG